MHGENYHSCTTTKPEAESYMRVHRWRVSTSHDRGRSSSRETAVAPAATSSRGPAAHIDTCVRMNVGGHGAIAPPLSKTKRARKRNEGLPSGPRRQRGPGQKEGGTKPREEPRRAALAGRRLVDAPHLQQELVGRDLGRAPARLRGRESEEASAHFSTGDHERRETMPNTPSFRKGATGDEHQSRIR